MAVCWGFQGTSPNENVSKLETQRQTDSQRVLKKDRHTDSAQTKKKEKNSKGAIKKKTE